MPHRAYGQYEVDARFPALTVPDDDDHDYGERPDELLKEGNRIAHEIAVEARTYGREPDRLD